MVAPRFDAPLDIALPTLKWEALDQLLTYKGKKYNLFWRDPLKQFKQSGKTLYKLHLKKILKKGFFTITLLHLRYDNLHNVVCKVLVRS